jgi:hypothetical protein
MNGITSVPNIMKIYQAVQKSLLGDLHKHIKTGDLISLLSVLESRLKMKWHCCCSSFLFISLC